MATNKQYQDIIFCSKFQSQFKSLWSALHLQVFKGHRTKGFKPSKICLEEVTFIIKNEPLIDLLRGSGLFIAEMINNKTKI